MNSTKGNKGIVIILIVLIAAYFLIGGTKSIGYSPGITGGISTYFLNSTYGQEIVNGQINHLLIYNNWCTSSATCGTSDYAKVFFASNASAGGSPNSTETALGVTNWTACSQTNSGSLPIFQKLYYVLNGKVYGVETLSSTPYTSVGNIQNFTGLVSNQVVTGSSHPQMPASLSNTNFWTGWYNSQGVGYNVNFYLINYTPINIKNGKNNTAVVLMQVRDCRKTVGLSNPIEYPFYYNRTVVMSSAVLGFGSGSSNSYSNTTTTTISGNSGGSYTSPPAPKISFWTALTSSVSLFLSNILSNFLSYFSLPSNLFSITTTGLSAKNATTVGTTVTITVNEVLSSQQINIPWSVGANKVIATSCGSYIFSNSSQSYVYQSSVVNMTSIYYNNTFTFTPTKTGVYVFGASCLFSNITYSNSAWSAWSTPVLILSQNQGIAVIGKNVSTTPPTTNVNISNSSFFNSITNAINSFINGILNFFSKLFGH